MNDKLGKSTVVVMQNVFSQEPPFFFTLYLETGGIPEILGRIAPAHPPVAVVDMDSMLEKLSDRESEVFRLLGRGWSTPQIAGQMNVSFKTVHSFRGRIKEKLKLSSATEVLREALRWHDRQITDATAQTN